MVSGQRARPTASKTRAPGMRRAPEHQVDDSTVGVVDRLFTNELRWIFTRNQVREYGIDGHAEAVTSGSIVTGRVLATQIKGGASQFRRPARDGSGWMFWASNDHLRYWLGYSMPVLVILVRPDDGAAFWQVVRPSTGEGGELTPGAPWPYLANTGCRCPRHKCSSGRRRRWAERWPSWRTGMPRRAWTATSGRRCGRRSARQSG